MCNVAIIGYNIQISRYAVQYSNLSDINIYNTTQETYGTTDSKFYFFFSIFFVLLFLCDLAIFIAAHASRKAAQTNNQYMKIIIYLKKRKIQNTHTHRLKTVLLSSKSWENFIEFKSFSFFSLRIIIPEKSGTPYSTDQIQ